MLFREDFCHLTQPAKISMHVRLSLKLYNFTHHSMQIFNANSLHVFLFKTNQKRGQYDFSKFLELISFVLF